MPYPKRLTFTGNIAHVYNDDGSQLTFVPSTENQWINRAPAPTTENPGLPGDSTGVTAEMVEAAVTSVGGSLSAMLDTSAAIAQSFNDAIAATYPGILSNKNRAACLVGECAQETDWFKTTTEYTAGNNWYSPYDGRGFIQLTHEGNYSGFGDWMLSLGLLTDRDYFVNNPARLADIKWASYTAIYYFTQVKWDNKNLFEWCDTSSSPWHDISRAINRGNPNSDSPSYGEADRTTAINAVLGVTPDPSGGQTGGADAVEKRGKVVSWMVSHLDDFRYSQNLTKRRDPITYGETDCSALINYCYRTQIGQHIGWWAGPTDDGMQMYGRAVVPKDQRGNSVDESILRPGDLFFFNWSTPVGPSRYMHVDMYIGNNQVCGHGGPDMGPNIKALDARLERAYNWYVRRYIED